MKDIPEEEYRFGDKLKDVVGLDWVFSSGFEKITLVILLTLGLWKVVDLLYYLFF